MTGGLSEVFSKDIDGRVKSDTSPPTSGGKLKEELEVESRFSIERCWSSFCWTVFAMASTKTSAEVANSLLKWNFPSLTQPETLPSSAALTGTCDSVFVGVGVFRIPLSAGMEGGFFSGVGTI